MTALLDGKRDVEIKNAPNGGVVVIERGAFDLGMAPNLLAAFASPADMITWLAAQYGLKSIPTPVKGSSASGDA